MASATWPIRVFTLAPSEFVIRGSNDRAASSQSSAIRTFSSVVSDSFGKTGRAILDALQKGETISATLIAKLARGSLRSKTAELEHALRRPLTEQQRELLTMLLHAYDSVDAQVAQALTVILMRLALHNVAFHMCEHFTPRAAYELLVDDILRNEETHPELPRIGFTMNFDTGEYCDECAAEYDGEAAEREARHQSSTDDNRQDFDSVDSVPF